jgi:hypothetical protein
MLTLLLILRTVLIYIYIYYIPEVVVVSPVLVLEREHDRCKAGEKAARDA